MKIAFPVNEFNQANPLESKIAQHFGPANFYLKIDETGKFPEKIQNTSIHHGGEKMPPEFLNEHEINFLICNDLGTKAIERFNNLKIEVFLTKSETVKRALQLWKEKKLTKATPSNTCHGNH